MRSKLEVYYLYQDGQTTGPWALEQLHEMWDEGRIMADTPYVQVGVWRKQPLSKILNKIIGYRKTAQAEISLPDEEPQATSLRGTHIATGAGLAFLIWLIASTVKPPENPSRALKAEVQEIRARLNVINWNNYDWRDETIVLNGAPPKGYKRVIRFLPAGESMSLLLTDFANPTGARFEPWSMPITEVWIGDERQGYRSVPPPAKQGPGLR